MPAFPLVLQKHVPIQSTLTLRSGTRVGGSKEELEIGGMENPVIRDPVSKEPYIPGSSLKGKLRHLMEWRHGKGQQGAPCTCHEPNCPVCILFGTHSQDQHSLGPSRLIVRDLFLTEESRQVLLKLRDEGLPMVELKSENIIDRQMGRATRVGGGFRTQERVPSGDARSPTQFQLNISLRVFKGDDESQFVAWVKQALSLLEKDTLGGSGTRGYGWVKIENLTVDGKPESL